MRLLSLTALLMSNLYSIQCNEQLTNWKRHSGRCGILTCTTSGFAWRNEEKIHTTFRSFSPSQEISLGTPEYKACMLTNHNIWPQNIKIILLGVLIRFHSSLCPLQSICLIVSQSRILQIPQVFIPDLFCVHNGVMIWHIDNSSRLQSPNCNNSIPKSCSETLMQHCSSNSNVQNC